MALAIFPARVSVFSGSRIIVHLPSPQTVTSIDVDGTPCADVVQVSTYDWACTPPPKPAGNHTLTAHWSTSQSDTATLVYLEGPSKLYCATYGAGTRISSFLISPPASEQAAGTADKTAGSAISADSSISLHPTTGTGFQPSFAPNTGNTRGFMRMFYSPPFAGVEKIPAGSWHWAGAASVAASSQTGTNVDLLAAYVWRPSTASKVGTIFDNTAETNHPAGSLVNTGIRWVAYDIAGAEVAGVQDGDVLVLEVWAYGYGGVYAGRSVGFYYGGATEAGANGELTGLATTAHAATLTAPVDLYDEANWSPPVPITVDPNHGPVTGGTDVTITGTAFTGATAVTFGGTAATNVVVVSATTITCTTPAHAVGAVDVAITTPNGIGVGAGAFTYEITASITDVSPSSGPTAGGTTVTITGTGLTGATSVTFGGTAASYTVDSATQITATTPAHAAGAVDVVVVVPSATLTATGAFTYNAPTVSSVSPDHGPTSGGTAVTVSGSNFTAGVTVTFGGSSATSVVVVNATTITCDTPAHAAGAVNVSVSDGTGTGTLVDGFTYDSPTVSGVSPDHGPCSGGTDVTITGTLFSGTATVTFGGTAATSVTVTSSTTITCTTPAHTAGNVNVVVTVAGETVTATGAFTYDAPTISDVSPNSGYTAGGMPVTITGTNFAGSPTVTFGGTAATDVVLVSGTSITCVNPPHAAGLVDVSVTIGPETATASDAFTYTANPLRVTSITPNHGPSTGGTAVTISGAGFTGVTAVRFAGGTATSLVVVSDGTITCTTPPYTEATPDPPVPPVPPDPPSPAAPAALLDFEFGDPIPGTRVFYVDPAGSDSADGLSSATAWQTLAKVATAALVAGDTVAFRRGGTWTGTLTIDGRSGTAGAPITLTNYGLGALPIIDAGGSTSPASVIHLTGGANYVTIDGLKLRNVWKNGVQVGDSGDASSAHHVTVQNCEITDTGYGVSLFGPSNRITANHIHDLHMIVDGSYGAVAIGIESSGNEIDHNRCVNCKAPSSASYGIDGGGFEFYGAASHNNVHHNLVQSSVGFFEIAGTCDANTLAYNVVLDCYDNPLGVVHTEPGNAISNLRVENNTITVAADIPDPTLVAIWFGAAAPASCTWRNNLCVLRPGQPIAVSGRTGFTHDHNLFWRTDGDTSHPEITFGTGESMQNPGLVSLADPRPDTGSPAINAGASLGYTADFVGTAVPQGAAPDIGAYEWVP